MLGNGQAIRYGIGVGREGFTWSGVKHVARKAEWPDWYPPAEMIARQPYLPRFIAGGPGNPLGARAMYLGGTEYRIHGTNDPSTIGKHVSTGCIRLTNEDVDRSLQPRAGRRQGDRAAADPAGAASGQAASGRLGQARQYACELEREPPFRTLLEPISKLLTGLDRL